MRGGTGDTTAGCGAAKTCIAGFASNSGGDWIGSPNAGYQDNVSGIVVVSNGSIDAGAGSITMMGRTSAADWYGILMYNGGTTVKAGGNITINGITASGGTGWGVYLAGTVWSTAGNVSITGNGSNGVYLDTVSGVGSISAGNATSNPSSGGTITINATGNTSGYYGLLIRRSSLSAFGAISITATSIAEHAMRIDTTGAKIQSASNITISATQASAAAVFGFISVR
jgi:hypothetical protein